MKILTAEEIRAADAQTILNEPIRSIDLMERAASACVGWIEKNIDRQKRISIFCGLGNNGGDGLAIARMLRLTGYEVQVYVVRYSKKNSADFELNEKRLQEIDARSIHQIKNPK